MTRLTVQQRREAAREVVIECQCWSQQQSRRGIVSCGSSWKKVCDWRKLCSHSHCSSHWWPLHDALWTYRELFCSYLKGATRIVLVE
jgi:hypothetical protein